ncbi:MAG: TetR/AcrR family transcriptional regulator C-terminal domain-containing protein [Clostridia bacterium]|nr:TetR/AcrR family transcriptional regulator C-terminal domain-containing protein [Clostridia bacterium]
MSALTKNALINSFMKILKEKNFDKITINDITADCGVARMTFYYHFEDIYDMVSYIIQEKLRAFVNKDFTYETWRQDYMAVYEAVLTEKVFFSKIFSSIDLRVIQSYLYTFARQYVLGIIDEQAKRLELTLNEKKREMVCSVYCYSMVGALLSWISRGMNEEPSTYVGRFCRILTGTLEVSLKNSTENL